MPCGRTPFLNLCQGQTHTYAVPPLLPSLSSPRAEGKMSSVSVNCICALGRGGENGNLKLSDIENSMYREERCLGKGETVIAAA